MGNRGAPQNRTASTPETTSQLTPTSRTMITTAVSLTIADARSALDAATARRSSIEKRLKSLRDSIEPLTRRVAAAIASGDDVLAEKLTAERAKAVESIPDVERAVEIASAEAERMDRDLARLEVPEMAAALEAQCKQFVGLVASANLLSSAILHAAQGYSQRFSRSEIASQPAADPRNARAIVGRTLTPLAAKTYHMMRDLKAD